MSSPSAAGCARGSRSAPKSTCAAQKCTSSSVRSPSSSSPAYVGSPAPSSLFPPASANVQAPAGVSGVVSIGLPSRSIRFLPPNRGQSGRLSQDIRDAYSLYHQREGVLERKSRRGSSSPGFRFLLRAGEARGAGFTESCPYKWLPSYYSLTFKACL